MPPTSEGHLSALDSCRFAVEYQPNRGALVVDRLLAGMDIDDRQAPPAQPYVINEIEAITIGPRRLLRAHIRRTQS